MRTWSAVTCIDRVAFWPTVSRHRGGVALIVVFDHAARAAFTARPYAVDRMKPGAHEVEPRDPPFDHLAAETGLLDHAPGVSGARPADREAVAQVLTADESLVLGFEQTTLG